MLRFIGGFASVAVGVVIVAGCSPAADDSESQAATASAVTNDSATSATPVADQPFPDSTAKGVILDPPALDGLLGARGVISEVERTAPLDHGGEIDRKECAASLGVAEKSVYDGSGYTAMQTFIARNGDGQDYLYVEQSAAVFPTSDDAETFFGTTKAKWPTCVGVPITSASDTDTSRVYAPGQTAEPDPTTITQLISDTRDPAFGCAHVMAVRENLVAESLYCGDNPTDQAERVVQAMLERAG